MMTDINWTYDKAVVPDSSFVSKIYANTNNNTLLWFLNGEENGYSYDLGTADSAAEIIRDIGNGASAGRIFANRAPWKFTGYVDEATVVRYDPQEDSEKNVRISVRLEDAFGKLKESLKDVRWGNPDEQFDAVLDTAVSVDTNAISLIVTDDIGQIETSVKIHRDKNFDISVRDGRVTVTYAD